MKARRCFGTLFLLVCAGSMIAQAQIKNFQHVLLIIQENRTPDNLFQGLCLPPYGSASACGTGAGQYDIQSYGYDVDGNQVALSPVALANAWDPSHVHAAFEQMCNPNTTTYYPCSQNTKLSTTNCPANCSFQYVDPLQTPTMASYYYLAQNFGWANRMFETSQGPSAPAHQFLFSGTSAPSAEADAAALYVTENPSNTWGCLAPLNSIYAVIDPTTAPNEYHLINNPQGTTCFSRPTMASLLQAKGFTWRYYSVGWPAQGISNSLWNAPDWIQDICQPDSTYSICTGADWVNNVDLTPSDVLLDIQNCNLKNMVWLTPKGVNSDHPAKIGADGGPAWVASVINSIATSTCTDTVNGATVPYWQDTAIIVTWDDWGGFYDHVLPPFLSAPDTGWGDYQMGFRVPLLFVSAYTSPKIDSTNQYDFGSILRFAEHNFGMTEGALGFADARSSTDLTAFYNLKQTPKAFLVPSKVSAKHFLRQRFDPYDPPDTD